MAELSVTLLDIEERRASRLAAELRECILSVDPTTDVAQTRGDPHKQDFGATLIILLGTPAVIAVAQGVKKWIERRGASRVEFRNGERTLILENLTNKSAETIASELVELLEEGKPQG